MPSPPTAERWRNKFHRGRSRGEDAITTASDAAGTGLLRRHRAPPGDGIASTCLLLTAIDRLLLRPIDVPYAESLVRAAVLESKGMVYTFFPYQVYAEFERETKTASAIAADANLDVAISRGGMPQPAVAHMVSGSYFRLLGVFAALGRALAPADDRGDGTAVVLSYGLWQRRRFGGVGLRPLVKGKFGSGSKPCPRS